MMIFIGLPFKISYTKNLYYIQHSSHIYGF